ncbi:hypothetical protein [Devosia aquimaris]|uniref:hypothetical protein n=1 Tax=Devosia aquimaris TaxID=2866214 RepID=UPI001CD097D6|nr:hypothetical protein [Devosia sp. CJK-A8-3]
MGVMRRIFDLAAIVVGSAMLLAIVVPIGLFAYVSFMPHLLLNETTRYLYKYRNMTGRNADISLVPDLFKVGEPKEQVASNLLGAGLDAWNTSYLKMPSGARSVQRFRLSAGIRDLACGSELFVVVGYDQGDLLTSATVEQGGACL